MAADDIAMRIAALLNRRFGSGGGSVPFDRADYLHAFGNVKDALLDAVLFVPEFVEVESCVFLKELGARTEGGWPAVADAVRQARETSAAALKRCVDSYNWVEVPYLTGNHPISDDEVQVLAEVITQAWRAHLKHRFPDRRLAVRLLGPEETGDAIAVGIEHDF